MAKKTPTEEVYNFTPRDLLTQTRGELTWLSGQGNTSAKVMFVAANPKQVEDANKTAFSGAWTEKLFELLSAAELNTNDFYYTYAVKFATYQDKQPSATQLKECLPLLKYEIETINPDIIVPLGDFAFRAVFGTGALFSECKGVVCEGKRFPDRKIFPLWNPGYLLREPQHEQVYRQDIMNLVRIMNGGEMVMSAADSVKFDVITNLNQVKALFNYITNNPVDFLSIDLEWKGKNYMQKDGYARTMQINFAKDCNVIFRFYPTQTAEFVPDPNITYEGCVPIRETMYIFNEFLKATGTKILGQNVREDGTWLLRKYGCDIRPNTFYDTMLAEHLIDNNMTVGLTDLTLRYTNIGKYDAELIFWKNKNKKLVSQHLGYACIPEEILFPYAAADVEVPRMVYHAQKEAMAKYMTVRGHNGEYTSLFDSVMSTELDLYEIEYNGLIIDPERLDTITVAYNQKRAEVGIKLASMVAARGIENWNPNSTAKVREVVFGPKDKGGLGLIPIESSGKKAKKWEWVMKQPAKIQAEYNPSTASKSLQILAEETQEPILITLLSYKRVSQMCKTFTRSAVDVATVTDDDVSTGDDVNDHIWFGGSLYEEGSGIAGNIWEDGKLHSKFSQLTNTGRFRTKSPNVQNFSKQAERFIATLFKKEDKPQSLRSMFVPDLPVTEDYVIIEADFSQAELFTLAGMSGDKAMMAALTTPGKDLHTETMVNSFGLQTEWNGIILDDKQKNMFLELAAKDIDTFEMLQKEFIYITPKGERLPYGVAKEGLRVAAKAVNFGIPYGRGAAQIALQIQAETGTDIPVSQVQTAIDGWKSTYSSAWAFMVEQQENVVNKGYVENPWGRRRYFPKVRDEQIIAANKREGGNFPIQSTVADTMRVATGRVRTMRDELKLKAEIINQVHDAIFIRCPVSEIGQVKKLLESTMGNIPIPMPKTGTPVTLRIDIEIYSRWGEKYKKKN